MRKQRREPLPAWAYACAGDGCERDTWVYCPACFEMYCSEHGRAHETVSGHTLRALPLGWAAGDILATMARKRVEAARKKSEG